MTELGINGTCTTIDPALEQPQVEGLTKIFPKEWFEKIKFVKATSQDAAKQLEIPDNSVELVYIDGDHRQEAVQHDWDWLKDKFSKYLIFDDYHFPTKQHKDMEISSVVDQITGYELECLIMDRRIYFDDRRYTDDQIDYGQVIVTNKNLDLISELCDW